MSEQYNAGSLAIVRQDRRKLRLDPKTINLKNNLAYEQSYGFFDDISNSQWKLLQQIARNTFPNHFTGNIETFATPGHNLKGEKEGHWYNQNFQEEFRCQFAERIPGHDPVPGLEKGDGAKWVCDPHRIAEKKDCLVYSIGSNGNIVFEQGVKSQIGEHCEIHTFDIMDGILPGRVGFAKQLEGIATFHHYGLGTQEEADKYKRIKVGRPIKTLDEIVKDLGHENRRIDIFKIDCEGCEWKVVHDMISDRFDIRQILVETHGAPLADVRDFFYSLHDAGYVITSKEPNLMAKRAIEFGFLKLSPEFLIEDSFYSESNPSTA